MIIFKEDGGVSMGDEAIKIFLNAKGTLDDVSDGLRAFFDYVAGKKLKDAHVERLGKAVNEAKNNREWRHEYIFGSDLFWNIMTKDIYK